MGKSGNRCAYVTCGKSKRDGILRLFRFPKDEKLCKKWKNNCGNSILVNLTPEELYKKRHVCENHFLDTDYRTEKRKFLKRTAVPIHYKIKLVPVKQQKSSLQLTIDEIPPEIILSEEEDEIFLPEDINVPEESKTLKDTEIILKEEEEDFLNENVNMPGEPISPNEEAKCLMQAKENKQFETKCEQTLIKKRTGLPLTIDEISLKTILKEEEEDIFVEDLNGLEDSVTPKEELIRKKYLIQNKKNKQLQNRTRQTSRKITRKASINKTLKKLMFSNSLSFASKLLIQMQFRQNKTKWSKAERDFSLSLYHKSPKTYIYLRKVGIVLPSVSIIRKLIS